MIYVEVTSNILNNAYILYEFWRALGKTDHIKRPMGADDPKEDIAS